MKKESMMLFFYSGREEDREAYRAVVGAGIDCQILGTFSEKLVEHDRPILYIGYLKLEGYEEIKKFIEAWKQNQR